MSSDEDSGMMTDDEGSNEVVYSSISVKENLYIIHKGSPPETPSPFATVNSKPRWPDDLWKSGNLIYDFQNKDKCLKSPTRPNDTVLRFESKFESGNLASVYHLGGDKYHLLLEYDHNSIGSAQWFYFRIKNTRKDVKYHFIISGFHKKKNLFSMGSKIFWYSEKQASRDRIGWSRGGSNYASGTTTKGKSNKKRASVQFNMKFPYTDDTVYLCYSLPYTYTDLTRYIHNWSRIAPQGFLNVDILCQTLGGRDCPILTMTSTSKSIPLSNRPYIFVTARIHPGESNGSFLMHGFIDFLLGSTGPARYLLDHYVFKIIPMLNIDGVIEGFYRISLSGNDLNRIWTDPDPGVHPVIHHTKALFEKLAKEKPVAMYLDFHGHARLHGTFAFGCPNPDDLSLRNKEKNFPRILSFLSDAFTWNNCVFSFPKDRKSAARIVVRTEMNVVQSFTIETSFGGITSGPRSGILYDENTWKELGSKCCEALFHYLSGEDSPISSYVSKELSFLSPSDDSSSTIEWAPKTPMPSKEKTIPQPYPPFSRKGPGMFRLAGPSSFFRVSPNLIADTQEDYVPPKWNQMQYILT